MSVGARSPERVSRSRRTVRLRAAAEALVFVAVIGCPLARGGVDPPVFFVLAVVAALALALVAVARRREGLPLPPAALALGLGAVVALLSAVPLPSFLVGLLSPRAKALASLPPEAARSFIAWSLDPPASLVDAVRLAAIAAVLVTAAALARREVAAKRLSISLAASGLVLGVVSAAHALAHVETFFGLFAARAQPILATTFGNPNHAASLFVLAAAASIGLFRAARTNLARFGWASAATANGVLCVTTLSNGGIGALVAMCVLVVALAAMRGRSSSRRGSLFGPVVLVVVVLSAALLFSAEEFIDQLRDVPGAAVGKAWAWPGTLRLIRDHWFTGVGRGAFSAAFAAYEPARTLSTITHPENFVLHWLAEWGVPAALAGMTLLALTVAGALRRPGDEDDALRPVHEALCAGILAVLLHDLVDFGLEFAGVGVPFVVALGVVAGRSAGKFRVEARSMLLAAGALALVFLPLGIGGSRRLVDVQLAQAASASKDAAPDHIDAVYRRVRDAHPADPFVDVAASERLLDVATDAHRSLDLRSDAVRRALPFLARAQELWNSDEPHLLTARALALVGHRAQAMTELRLAFEIDGDTGAAVDEGLRMRATPDELATLPVALAREMAGKTDDRWEFSPARQAAVVVGHLRAVRGDVHLARLTAEKLLDVADAPWTNSPDFLTEACEATVADGDRLRAAGATKDALAAVAGTLGRLATALRAADPTTGHAYWCAYEGHLFSGDPAGADTILADGVKALPRDVPLHVSLARRKTEQNEPDQVLRALDGITDARAGAYAREVRERRVWALLAVGREQRAEAEAAECAQANPTVSWSHALYAHALSTEGLYVRATQEASLAVRLAKGAEKDALVKFRSDLVTKTAGELPPAESREPSMTPTLSLCLTTLDRENLFPQTLRTLAAQEFDDFELVVVDNASKTDYARQAVEALNDPRVRFLRHDKRISMGENWNSAVALSRGRYVAVVHDDDLYHPRFARETVARLERDATLAFVHTLTERIDEAGRPIGSCDLGWPERVEGAAFRRRMALHPSRSLVEAQSVVMRRSAFDAAGPFLADWVQCTDGEMWLRLARHGAVGYLREPLVTVRLRVAPKEPSQRHLDELVEKVELARRMAVELPPLERLVAFARRDAVVAEQIAWTLLYADGGYLAEKGTKMAAQGSLPTRFALGAMVAGARTVPARALLDRAARWRRSRQLRRAGERSGR